MAVNTFFSQLAARFCRDTFRLAVVLSTTPCQDHTAPSTVHNEHPADDPAAEGFRAHLAGCRDREHPQDPFSSFPPRLVTKSSYEIYSIVISELGAQRVA